MDKGYFFRSELGVYALSDQAQTYLDVKSIFSR